jgi:hypothetical protein
VIAALTGEVAYGYGGSDAQLQVDIYVEELSPVG